MEDWEGSTADVAAGNMNFLALLTELRSVLGTGRIITATASIGGSIGPDTSTSSSGFAPHAKMLDYVNLMTVSSVPALPPTFQN